MSRTNVQKVLLAAADLLEANGWTQGQFKRGDCLCVLGAINVAAGQPFDEFESCDAESVFFGHLNLSGRGLADWNDEDGRTSVEVIEALRDCAAKAVAS